MSSKRKNHWEDVYVKKAPEEVSWYQTKPTKSLEFISSINLSLDQKIIDVGGGASVLVDKLLDYGFEDLSVLDVSSKALDHSRKRLGSKAENVKWIQSDITEFEPLEKYDLWHDRAVFHFLTEVQDRKKYVQNMSKALNSGGHIIISTFALDGPLKCSGLDVERYSPEKLRDELGGSFEFVKSAKEVHATPWTSEQKFTYCHFKKITEYEG